jgi:hypothetical protein
MTTEQFVTRLKLLVKDCSYKDLDEMVRDRIVFGTKYMSYVHYHTVAVLAVSFSW